MEDIHCISVNATLLANHLHYPMTNAIWSVVVGVRENHSPPPLVVLNMLVALEFAVIDT